MTTTCPARVLSASMGLPCRDGDILLRYQPDTGTFLLEVSSLNELSVYELSREQLRLLHLASGSLLELA